MPSDVMPDVTPHRVTPAAGKGALGTWRARARPRTLCRGRGAIHEPRPVRKPPSRGVHMCQHLSLLGAGKAAGGQPGSEPDSGNPTVRDRRGASGNVATGAGLRATAKAVDSPPDPTARAPELYPDSGLFFCAPQARMLLISPYLLIPLLLYSARPPRPPR